MTSAPLTARAIARHELTRSILASARSQLAETGPAQLSVRAVARDLGMASSAVYRYFPSRDELLTEMLVNIYGELADALDVADAAVDRSDLRGRWIALCRTLRTWALAAPHEYALLYGSPVPGYRAPEATVVPSARVTGVLLALVRDLDRTRPLPPLVPLPGDTHDRLAAFRAQAGEHLSDEAILRGVTAWGGLLGAISLELFGHLHRAVIDYDAHFELITERLDPTR